MYVEYWDNKGVIVVEKSEEEVYEILREYYDNPQDILKLLKECSISSLKLGGMVLLGECDNNEE